MNNNGVVNQDNNTTNDTRFSEIKASKVYKLAPEEKPVEEAPKIQTEVVVPLVEEKKEEIKQKPRKKRNILAYILFFVIIGLLLFIFFMMMQMNKKIAILDNNCSPVSTLKEEKKLDLNATIVQDLYSKVKTNIREDLAETNLNDSMKLYLAYRQLSHEKFYDSNCNLFSDTAMMPYTCLETLDFTPKAFKEESLIVEYKKLFGEHAIINLGNIQIGKNCIGGYQYIAERGEFVQGYCASNVTTTFRVKKELISATSKESTITLKEKVKYTISEGQELPDKLKNGTYVYVFKLDSNYNYVFINKYLEQE